MSYSEQIKNLQKVFDDLTSRMHKAKEEGKEDTYKELSIRRTSVYEEITKLNRRKWEEMHDTFHMDDR